MNLFEFKNLFSKLKQIDETANQLQFSGSKIHWKGISFSARALISSQLAKQVPGNHLFVLSDKEEAAYFFNDLEQIFPEEKNFLFFPASYRNAYHFEETDNANVVSRAEVLEKINNGTNTWIITYPQALFEKVPTQKKLTKNTLRVEKGKKYSLDFMNELLLEYHFERVDFVYEPGQFAIRGGILDCYSYSNDLPFRIEFFGDEVDSIRTFDPVDQLSQAKHDFFNIIPNVQGSFLHDDFASFISFMGSNSTLWLSSNQLVTSCLGKEYEKAVKIYEGLNHTLKQTIPSDLYLHKTEWESQISALNIIEWGPDFSFKADLTVNFTIQSQPVFNKNFELLRDDLIARKSVGFTNLFFSNQPKQTERLYSIMEDIGADVDFVSMPIALHEGFIIPEIKLACYTDHQIFERYHRFKLKDGFTQAKQALTLKEIYNLQKGDYVTHIDHGVGQFSGLQTIDVNGTQQEAIRLIYKDGDVLYVSIHSLHRI
ncbi:MAG: CarD family transcriptional regulator, partial [Bacteroidota bacterium]